MKILVFLFKLKPKYVEHIILMVVEKKKKLNKCHCYLFLYLYDFTIFWKVTFQSCVLITIATVLTITASTMTDILGTVF